MKSYRLHTLVIAFFGLVGAFACRGTVSLNEQDSAAGNLGTSELGNQDTGEVYARDAGPDGYASARFLDSGTFRSGTVPIFLETALDSSKKYRFAIVWYQFDGAEAASETEVVHDVAFDPRRTSITLPDVPVPGPQNILCRRDGSNEAARPCQADSPYNLGLAQIVIVEDVNGNGNAEVPYAQNADPGADKIALWAWAHLVYSARAGDVLPQRKPGGQPVPMIDGPTMAGTVVYEAYSPRACFDHLRSLENYNTLVFKSSAPNLK
jgi:hypothetical protein